MHDPKTVAFEIKNPFVRKIEGYSPNLITIWHCDPETDGSDDSCGWFMRSRHIDKAVIEKVRKEFEFNFKHNYWFDETGKPKMSVMGTVLEMYTKAAWIIFIHQNNDRPNRKRHRKFMQKHLYEILNFAENPFDSIGDSVTMRFGFEEQDYRIGHFVSVIVADILRKEQKWWQHPRWHIHHWQIKFHPFQNLKRRYWDKCCICQKRGFTGSAFSDWSGTKIWHSECNHKTQKVVCEN